jgi:hypothetical protein
MRELKGDILRRNGGLWEPRHDTRRCSMGRSIDQRPATDHGRREAPESTCSERTRGRANAGKLEWLDAL